MAKIITRAFIDALGTTVYIILVASFVFYLQRFSSKPDHTLLIPIAMLLLFVCSAAITGFLVLGKPVMLYMDGKKRESILLLSYTLGILFLITIVSFISLIVYLNSI
ncbi:hypothetical protein KW787_02340 [Candidatus Pacearchaeota archaeon]|nr:hypothetical protein [Candidatus Pacearchaeota archaeon]